jgi:hypothetical protein
MVGLLLALLLSGTPDEATSPASSAAAPIAQPNASEAAQNALPPALPEDGWKQVVDGEVKVFARSKPGERVAEIRAEMVMDATPAEVRATLNDQERASHAPYVAEDRILARPAPNVKICYARLNFPIVKDRDYFIEVTLEQDLDAQGHGVYHSVWKPWGLDRPPRDGVVRVTTNQGYWDVRAEGGDEHRSHVTYYLLSDPGGSIPAWIINEGNKQVMPKVLKALRDDTVKRRGTGAGSSAAPAK